MSKRFSLDAVLVLVGLGIQVVSLPKTHPLTFSLYLVGAAVTVLGCVLYAWRLLRYGWQGHPAHRAEGDA